MQYRKEAFSAIYLILLETKVCESGMTDHACGYKMCIQNSGTKMWREGHDSCDDVVLPNCDAVLTCR